MRTTTFIFLLIASVTLIAAGCNKEEPPTQTNQETITEQSNFLDTLSEAGLKQKEITVKEIPLTVEIADNDQTKKLGLSHRVSLEDGRGMLFDFSDSAIKRPGFWMKNMNFSIDIIWINEDRIVDIDANVPFETDPNQKLPTYSPSEDITHVLEVPAGWSEQNEVKVLDQVVL